MVFIVSANVAEMRKIKGSELNNGGLDLSEMRKTHGRRQQFLYIQKWNKM